MQGGGGGGGGGGRGEREERRGERKHFLRGEEMRRVEKEEGKWRRKMTKREKNLLLSCS